MQFLIKLSNGVPTGYPMLLDNVKQVSEEVFGITTSFILPADVEPMGYGVWVYTTPTEITDKTKQNKEVTATDKNSDGEWLQKFVHEDVVFNTPEDEQLAIASTLSELAFNARKKRDVLLADTDWTSMSDAPTQATEMTAYRTLLRNLPAQADFPTTINWPTAP